MKNAKITASILSIAIVFSMCLSITAYASQNSNTDLWVVKSDTSGNTYLENSQTHEIMIAAFKIDSSGNRIDVDLVEHARELNEQSVLPSNLQPSVEGIQSTTIDGTVARRVARRLEYQESGVYTKIGYPQKVTPDIGGYAAVNYGQSVTIGEEFDSSIALDATVKSIVRAGASFTWASSASSSSQFNATFYIPEGRIGYVKFCPYYRVTYGALYIGQNSYYIEASSPKTLSNGLADGIYQVVLK